MAPRGICASEAVMGASVWEEGEAGGPHPHVLSRSRKGAGPPGPHLAPSATDPVSHQLKIARVRAWGTPTSPSLICHLPNPFPLCPFQYPAPLPEQPPPSPLPQPSTLPQPCPTQFTSSNPPPNALCPSLACFPATSSPCPAWKHTAPYPSCALPSTQHQA